MENGLSPMNFLYWQAQRRCRGPTRGWPAEDLATTSGHGVPTPSEARGRDERGGARASKPRWGLRVFRSRPPLAEPQPSRSASLAAATALLRTVSSPLLLKQNDGIRPDRLTRADRAQSLHGLRLEIHQGVIYRQQLRYGVLDRLPMRPHLRRLR